MKTGLSSAESVSVLLIKSSANSEQRWNQEEKVIRKSVTKTGTVDWKEVDRLRIEYLPQLLAEHGLVILPKDRSISKLDVEAGSLWNRSQLEHLARVWHRLTPWPDTCPGLELLNEQYSTVALSNTYNDLLKGLVAHSSIPLREVYSADMFQSYKPNARVYLGAAEKMGVKPEECALVAAHLGDLKGAKGCGFYAIYVERHQEEKNPELQGEDIPDMVVKADENGFFTLADRLGIRGE
jgi:2-haloacid dehalogenase